MSHIADSPTSTAITSPAALQVAAAQLDSSSSLDTQDGDVDPAKVKVELASIQRQIEELKWSMYTKPDDSSVRPSYNA